jgi:hypothetical protein
LPPTIQNFIHQVPAETVGATAVIAKSPITKTAAIFAVFKITSLLEVLGILSLRPSSALLLKRDASLEYYRGYN